VTIHAFMAICDINLLIYLPEISLIEEDRKLKEILIQVGSFSLFILFKTNTRTASYPC